jgi:hypothetical protein
MIHHLLHWANVELWGPIWPNTVAPSVWTLAAVAAAHVRSARQRQRHHEDLKQHVTDTAKESEGK